jgi:cation transport protein ChaC
MRLTPDLVALVAPDAGGEPSPMRPGFRRASDADHDGAVRDILAGKPTTGEVWIFAYGSLIWKPAFDFVEQRIGHVHGWHRSFCLGWDRRFRGSTDRPGLMLALDRGGECKGVAFRLPPQAIDANLAKVVRREMVVIPSSLPARWVSVKTDHGPIGAVAFVVDRKAPAYIGGLSFSEIADALSVAAGQLGSMADYLHSTVKHLEELGLHDKHLWRLQELVADRIEATIKGS